MSWDKVIFYNKSKKVYYAPNEIDMTTSDITKATLFEPNASISGMGDGWEKVIIICRKEGEV